MAYNRNHNIISKWGKKPVTPWVPHNHELVTSISNEPYAKLKTILKCAKFNYNKTTSSYQNVGEVRAEGRSGDRM